MARARRIGTRREVARATAWALLAVAWLACGDATPGSDAPGADAPSQADAPGADAPSQADAPGADAPSQADASGGDAPSQADASGVDTAAQPLPPSDPPSAVDPDGAAPVADADLLPEDASGIQDGLQPQAPPPERESYWLLTEFDWGDDREVVYESTRFDPLYTCHKKNRGICALTQVDVDGEDLLAEFHFNQADRLFQMAFLTPNLDRQQADAHLERVWKGLRDYVTHHRGEPVEAGELPALDSLEVGLPKQTHLWESDGLVARLAVGRRDDDAYYTIVWFSDPSQPQERRAYLGRLELSDRQFRQRRAAASQGASGGR